MEEMNAGNDRQSENGTDGNVMRVLVWIGVGVLSAAVAFAVLRTLLGGRRAGDPTTQRIQQLIDEANQLLKTLDDQRSG